MGSSPMRVTQTIIRGFFVNPLISFDTQALVFQLVGLEDFISMLNPMPNGMYREGKRPIGNHLRYILRYKMPNALQICATKSRSSHSFFRKSPKVILKFFKMTKEKVSVIFDRRKNVEKSGFGYVEIQIYLSRDERKYIALGRCAKDEVEAFLSQPPVKDEIKRCHDCIAAMSLFKDNMTIDNFDIYYQGIKDGNGIQECRKSNLKTDFIAYMKEYIEKEIVSEGTRKHKMCSLEAVKRFGKIKTFADLTSKNLVLFDTWLHDGTRTDISVHTYHKHLRKITHYLHITDMIPADPYDQVKFSRGKSKERRPLSEEELTKMRKLKLDGKEESVRDLFVFSAYTGLAFCDVMAFDFDTMTDKEGKLFYIDGSRLKTGTQFFTPILKPAMEVLKKYDFKLPRISNQKANDYLHLIQAAMKLNKNLTFHIARHSFATLALAHDVPIENVARMLGHQNIRTTQIYAKVLKSTIERHAVNLQKAIR